MIAWLGELQMIQMNLSQQIWRPKICVLVPDALYFFDKEEQMANGEWKAFVSLNRVKRITREKGDSGRKFCFRIVSATGETYLSASSEEELEEWINKIKPFTKVAEEPEVSALYMKRYEAGRTVGVGGYAEVFLGKDLKQDRKVAIKVVKKNLADQKGIERLEREISFLSLLDHPNVVKLYDVLNEPEVAVLIMEFIDGETLDDFVYESKNQYLPDYVSRFLFRKLLDAVRYCHEMQIVHRDLKMENIMVNSQGDLWLLDFGLSNRWHPGLFLETYCGTLEYAAPEVISKQKPYEGGPCDVWSLGVILFLMLTGKFPFEEESLPLILEKMKQGHTAINFPSQVDPDARDLFELIFNPNPAMRIRIEQILNHPWFQDDKEATKAKALGYFATLE